MKTLKMALTALVLGGSVAMSGAARADDSREQGWRGDRASYCYDANDWRSRDPNYCPPGDGRRVDDRRYDDRRYDDRRYDDRRYDDRRYDDRRYDDRRYGDGRWGGRGDRIVQRQEFPTPYRARIVLVERVIWTPRGEDCVCTVSARGPDAGYVSHRQLRRIARNYCSPRSRIQIDRY